MIRAHEYLEKICANVWHLPRIPSRRQVRLLRAWLEEKIPADFLATVLRLVHRHDFLPANARRIKAFANALLRYYYSRCIFKDGELLSAPGRTEAPMICLMASLQQFHPHLWRHVESEPEFLIELQHYARGTLNKLLGAEGAIRRTKDLHPELAVLELPNEGSLSGPVITFASRFADRAYGNVLHVQRLLATLDLTLPYIRRYLGR